ncbi:uncharacterized protein VNE69_08127 [Vairimorpha necatrix]|uniref:Uncharacterized protein n=1 Tax=Vairimorpha necatrix TaxID=6039 RepID=A0AAX4JEF2_9MICR
MIKQEFYVLEEIDEKNYENIRKQASIIIDDNIYSDFVKFNNYINEKNLDQVTDLLKSHNYNSTIDATKEVVNINRKLEIFNAANKKKVKKFLEMKKKKKEIYYTELD